MRNRDKQRGQHLNPLAIILFMWQTAKDFIYLVIGVAFSKHLLIALLTLVVVVTVVALLKYLTFTYRILPNEIMVKRGLIFRKQQHIPYERIQAIQTRQWIFLKPFGVEEVIVNNAADSKDNGKIDLIAVKTQIAPILEQRHLAATQPTSDVERVDSTTTTKEPTKPTVDDENRYQIKAPDMFAFALTNFHPIVTLLALLSVLDRLHIHFDNEVNVLTNWASSISRIFSIVIGAVIFLMVISLVQTVIKYYRFTLTKQNDHLVIEKGFFQRRTINVPINKIQAVEFKENILNQLFHLTSVRVHLITGKDSDDEKSVVTIMPVVNTKLAFQFMHRFIGTVPNQPIDFKGGDKRSQWIFVRNGLLAPIIIGAGIGIFYRGLWLWLMLILLVIYVIINGIYKGRSTAIEQINASQVAFQSVRLMTRRRMIVNWHQIQSVNLRQSIWMVHTNRAHLALAIRSGYTANQFELRYLPLSNAQTIFNWYHQFKQNRQ
ncbi:PH domain-containing protein [Lactobacillaceae bacterium Melli_B4]